MTERHRPDWSLEKRLWRDGAGTVVGLDEAGRGCLAGPVFAAAVILPAGAVGDYRDSKELTPERREQLADELAQEAIAAAVAQASAAEVDSLGILAATHLAASRALATLPCEPRRTGLVTDYLKLAWPGPVLAPARADSISLQVAAASILAKTARDRHLRALGEVWPGYGFARHKGYGTRQHLAMLDELGPSPEHRLTFAPVRDRLPARPEGIQCPRENTSQRRHTAAEVH